MQHFGFHSFKRGNKITNVLTLKFGKNIDALTILLYKNNVKTEFLN